MTLSTSENKGRRPGKRERLRYLLIMAGISLFCLLFSVIYRHFSHGVDSPYMTFLCAWPFILGFVPGMIWYLADRMAVPGVHARCFYHAGLASVTMSSLLRGVMEIAGTASGHQVILMRIGFGLLLLGVIRFLYEVIRRK